MARFTTEIQVDAPASRVFAYLEDFSNAADWDPGIATAERLDDGPVGIGSRFGLDLLVAGRTQEWVYEVTEHTAPQRVTFTTRSATATGVDRVSVTADGDSCRVTWDASFGFTGPLGRFIDPVFSLVFRRIAGKAVGGLRAALAGLAFDSDTDTAPVGSSTG